MRLDEIRSNPALNPKLDFYTQITHIINKHGGTINDYLIHNSSVNRIGFYGGTPRNPDAKSWEKDTRPMSAPVVSDKPFSKQFTGYSTPERGGLGPAGSERKYGTWFTPLNKAINVIKSKESLPFSNTYVFLVKLKPNAWLQPVDTLSRIKTNLVGSKPPSGKERVGQYSSSSGIAVLFKSAYDVVGTWTQAEITAMNTRADTTSVKSPRPNNI
jgi:hypothetical protein